MNERVVEILVYIMTEIRGNNYQTERLEVISRDLVERGYTQIEISSAFSWLFERFSGEPEEFASGLDHTLPGSFRVLSEAERMVITPESYGYLLQLRQLNIITDFEIEVIIEKALMLGGTKLTVTDVKALVATALFNPKGFGDRALFLYDDNNVIH